MDEPAPHVQTGVQGVSSGPLLLLGASVEDPLSGLQVHVTQVVQPEVVDGRGGLLEGVGAEGLVGVGYCHPCSVQNPLIWG